MHGDEANGSLILTLVIVLRLLCQYRYAGKMSRLEAEQCLESAGDGTYLVRKSESRTDYTHAIAIKLV